MNCEYWDNETNRCDVIWNKWGLTQGQCNGISMNCCVRVNPEAPARTHSEPVDKDENKIEYKHYQISCLNCGWKIEKLALGFKKDACSNLKECKGFDQWKPTDSSTGEAKDVPNSNYFICPKCNTPLPNDFPRDNIRQLSGEYADWCGDCVGKYCTYNKGIYEEKEDVSVSGEQTSSTVGEGHPSCCGVPMLVAGRWYHCNKPCGMKLVRVEYEGATENFRRIITELLGYIISDEMLNWKTFSGIMHEIWRESYYEDYEGKYPEEWYPYPAQVLTPADSGVPEKEDVSVSGSSESSAVGEGQVDWEDVVRKVKREIISRYEQFKIKEGDRDKLTNADYRFHKIYSEAVGDIYRLFPPGPRDDEAVRELSPADSDVPKEKEDVSSSGEQKSPAVSEGLVVHLCWSCPVGPCAFKDGPSECDKADWIILVPMPKSTASTEIPEGIEGIDYCPACRSRNIKKEQDTDVFWKYTCQCGSFWWKRSD